MSSIMATEPRKTGGKRALKRVGRSSKPKFLDVTGWICLIWLAILVFVAIFGKWLAPHDPQALDQANQLLYPNADNWLGTDTLGRDIFSRIVAGVGPTLYGPLLIVVIAGVGGTVLAVVAAWWGGWVDAIISRAMDIIFAFPGIILAVLAVAMLGRGMVAPVVALSIATIPMVGRIVRSTARRERAMPYISALQVQGAPLFSLWFRHLIPNIAPTVLVQSFVGFGYALPSLFHRYSDYFGDYDADDIREEIDDLISDSSVWRLIDIKLGFGAIILGILAILIVIVALLVAVPPRKVNDLAASAAAANQESTGKQQAWDQPAQQTWGQPAQPENPYGQQQNPYGQTPTAQQPEHPYGQQQNPYGRPQPGQDPYGQPQPGQDPYGRNQE